MRPQNPPNAEKKWKAISEKMKPHKERIDYIVEIRKQSLINHGFQVHKLHDLVAIGYAMALEDNGLDDW